MDVKNYSAEIFVGATGLVENDDQTQKMKKSKPTGSSQKQSHVTMPGENSTEHPRCSYLRNNIK